MPQSVVSIFNPILLVQQSLMATFGIKKKSVLLPDAVPSIMPRKRAHSPDEDENHPPTTSITSGQTPKCPRSAYKKRERERKSDACDSTVKTATTGSQTSVRPKRKSARTQYNGPIKVDKGSLNHTENVYFSYRQKSNHQKRKFLVAESVLLSLFNFCVKCGNEAQGHINHRMGTFINIIQKCEFCCHKKSWNSKPFVGSIPAGNLQLSVAILFAGAIPTQALRILEFLKMAHTNIDTFFMHQRYYLQPAITHFWKQESYFEEVRCGGGSIVVAGDGHADSPGHSAKFGIYNTMDVNTGKVVSMEIVQVKHRCMKSEELTKSMYQNSIEDSKKWK